MNQAWVGSSLSYDSAGPGQSTGEHMLVLKQRQHMGMCCPHLQFFYYFSYWYQKKKPPHDWNGNGLKVTTRIQQSLYLVSIWHVWTIILRPQDKISSPHGCCFLMTPFLFFLLKNSAGALLFFILDRSQKQSSTTGLWRHFVRSNLDGFQWLTLDAIQKQENRLGDRPQHRVHALSTYRKNIQITGISFGTGDPLERLK